MSFNLGAWMPDLRTARGTIIFASALGATMAELKVGVLGSGDVGKRLAEAFINEGHEVRLGTREPGKPEIQDWVKTAGGKAGAATFQETAAFADLVVVALNGKATVEVVQGVAGELAGKTVIDATNPLSFEAENQPPSLFVSGTNSLGEQVQQAAPKAHVVKAFNIIGNPDMYRPELAGGPPTMFYCGNDVEAKKQVAGILTDFGHEPADIGGIEASRYLEAMTMVWVRYGAATGGWRHGFKMLKKA